MNFCKLRMLCLHDVIGTFYYCEYTSFLLIDNINLFELAQTTMILWKFKKIQSSMEHLKQNMSITRKILVSLELQVPHE